MTTILVLTTIGLEKGGDGESVSWDKTRAIGWWPVEDLAHLEEGLSRNMCDLEEAGWYQYAVIEELSKGAYPDAKSERWYSFDRDKGGFFPCQKPSWAANTCGWGLG